MKISDITKIVTENLRDKYLKDNLKVVDYIPVSQKIAIAKSIVNTAMRDERGELRLNSPSAYILYTMVKIDTWTNIKIEFDNKDYPFDKQYDDLDRLGLIEKIIDLLPKKDSAEFDSIYGMVLSDVQNNEMSTKYLFEKVVANFGTHFGEMVAPVINALAEKEGISETES